MRRGTTPVITIETDIDLSLFEYILLTITDRARNQVNIESSSGAISVSGNSLTARLTQEETLSLLKGSLKLQLRIADENGNAIASNIMTGQMDEILNEEVVPLG